MGVRQAYLHQASSGQKVNDQYTVPWVCDDTGSIGHGGLLKVPLPIAYSLTSVKLRQIPWKVISAFLANFVLMFKVN